jgi:hypothetical protein
MTAIEKGKWQVKGIGGVLLSVLGQGTIDFVATVTGKERPGQFNNALFVPSLNANLVSILTATDSGAKILFSGNHAVFKLHGKVIMTGQRSGKGLYLLNIRIIDNTGSTLAAVAKKKVSLSTVHQRFAHLNCRAIRRMVKKRAVEGLDELLDDSKADDPCNGCIY